MKNIIKWTLFIIIATVAMAAGMFCLAQYLDNKECDCGCDGNCDCKVSKPVKKAFSRHYTKLNLS